MASHTFKVILAIERRPQNHVRRHRAQLTMLLQNLADFTTTVDEVELRAGLDFFAALDNNEELPLESHPRAF